MLRAYKYRIYPTPEQQKLIEQTFGAARLVYNLGLEIKIAAWKSLQKRVSGFDLGLQLKEVRSEHKWISEVDSQSLYGSLKHLDSSFAQFFKGHGFPKFKKKKGRQSFQTHGNTRRIDWDRSTLTIPKLIGIPIALSRKFSGSIKTVTISRTATCKYFATILVEDPAVIPEKSKISPDTTIGIDLGLKSFVVTDSGKQFLPNQYLKKNFNRLQCLQRRASRKMKGSNNHRKENLRVAKLHEKIANQRADYIHKITTQLIRDNQAETFVIEDLNVAGMVKNRRLSRAISDASFSEFRRQMAYKCEWYGKNFIVINRFVPSSKRCSDCGEINQELTLEVRKWACPCGANHDRDINAAKNIRLFGLEQISPAGSRGEPVESRRLR